VSRHPHPEGSRIEASNDLRLEAAKRREPKGVSAPANGQSGPFRASISGIRAFSVRFAADSAVWRAFTTRFILPKI
jgi:hypothetical protein